MSRVGIESLKGGARQTIMDEESSPLGQSPKLNMEFQYPAPTVVRAEVSAEESVSPKPRPKGSSFVHVLTRLLNFQKP
ncbi:hypothetical protein GQ457_07G025880 [Hibiscus cannabinus]